MSTLTLAEQLAAQAQHATQPAQEAVNPALQAQAAVSRTSEQVVKAEEAALKAQYAALGLSEATYFFKPKAEPFEGGHAVKVKDKDGKEVTRYKRPAFKAFIPYTTKEALTKLLTTPETERAAWDFIIELVNKSVYTAGQDQVNEAIKTQAYLLQDHLKVRALDVYALATAEKAPSTRGIPKETWADFKIDFVTVLNKAHGVSIDGATKASKIIADDRLASLKTAQLNIIEKFKELLASWYSSTSEANQDKFASILEESALKLETYAAKGEQSFLDSIS